MNMNLINKTEGLSKLTQNLIEEENPSVVNRHTLPNSISIRTTKTIFEEVYVFSPDIDIYSIDMLVSLDLNKHNLNVVNNGYTSLFPAYKLSEVEKLSERLTKCSYCSPSDMKYRVVFEMIVNKVRADYKMDEYYESSNTLDTVLHRTELRTIKNFVMVQAISTSEKLGLSKEKVISRISSAIRQKFKVTSRNKLLKNDFHKIINFVIGIDLEKMNFRSHFN